MNFKVGQITSHTSSAWKYKFDLMKISLSIYGGETLCGKFYSNSYIRIVRK